jgi:hypothetical protein
LGFERCIVPQRNVRELNGAFTNVIGVGSLREALTVTGCTP